MLFCVLEPDRQRSAARKLRLSWLSSSEPLSVGQIPKTEPAKHIQTDASMPHGMPVPMKGADHRGGGYDGASGLND